MKIYTKDSLIQSLIAIRDRGWIPATRPNNDGGVGHTLEDLLGIDENNLPIPNAGEWELKAQKKSTTALLTLFHMEPSPRAFRWVSAVLLPQWGWPHQEAGRRYPVDEKSFRQTISARTHSDRGFIVRLDRQTSQVQVEFDADQIDRYRHSSWYRHVAEKSLATPPYWGFDDLFHKAGSKLHHCFWVRAASQRIDGVLHFHYQDIVKLEKLAQERFMDALENGDVYIDFDARTGHNHGTKFRLRRTALPNLYAHVHTY